MEHGKLVRDYEVGADSIVLYEILDTVLDLVLFHEPFFSLTDRFPGGLVNHLQILRRQEFFERSNTIE